MHAREKCGQAGRGVLDIAPLYRLGFGELRTTLAAILFNLWALTVAATSAGAQVQIVSLELVLAIDVSASVDDSEFELQISGIAKAFRQPEIIDAILQHPEGVAVALVQWGSEAESTSDPAWRLLNGRSSILRYAAEIETVRRRQVGPLTAIGQAIKYSTWLIETNGFHGRQRKIDISGDGHSNFGVPIIPARHRAFQAGITISGLAILTDEPKLFDYYEKQIVGGASAFVLQAASYDDFFEAMERKLLGELSIQISSPASPTQNAAALKRLERQFRPGSAG